MFCRKWIIRFMDTTTHTHVFTEAGLGEAPFRFTGIRENLFQAAPGAPVRGGGSCDFCGQGIRYECAIISKDGKHHVVGQDCIRKVGDRGLIDAARAEKNRIIREARFVKEEAARNANDDNQREQNGGATDWERGEADRINDKVDRKRAIAPAVEILSGYADILEDGRGGFRDSVACDFRNGSSVSDNAARIAAEIVAKEAGRKNSKAYTARYNEVFPVIAEAVATVNA